MKFSDLDLHKFGSEFQLTAVVFSKDETSYVLPFPGESTGNDMMKIDLDTSDWQRLIRQTDLVEVEALAKAKDGKIVKTMLRKSSRQIEQSVAWKVYKRDEYKCRYCNADDVPLTVDHLVLWENGGPSTVENLVAACRKCNRIRGNTEYEDWLKSDLYKKRSQNLSESDHRRNWDIVPTLKDIPIRINRRSR